MTFGASLDPYRSPLTDLGIEETEPMVCEDNVDNRRALRNANIMWSALMDPDTGQLTGLIRAFTDEELTARRDTVWETKKPIMVDPGNPYSEYLPAEDLPMDSDIPWWIKLRLRGWMEDEMKGKPLEKRYPFPERCEIIRTDGTRCWSWAGNPRKTKRCKKHMPWEMEADTANAKLAKIRMLQMAPSAADTLEGLMTNPHESGAVRLKASTEILDRAGVRGGTELDVTGKVEVLDSSKEVQERLARLADRMEEAAAARAAALARITEEAESAVEKSEDSLPLPSLPANQAVVSGEVVAREPSE
jgi:hypothetical protein